MHRGSHFDLSTNDWPDAMQWVKENTPEDAVIAAWWDYGYWISTLSERKTLADNSTLIDWQIRKIASMYMSTPDSAWQILVSDTETDVSSYYVTLPDEIKHPTRQSDNIYNANDYKLKEFSHWRETRYIEKDCDPYSEYSYIGCYEPEIAKKYPTLFDYWASEIFKIPPVITGLDADYILINLAAEKLSEDNILDLYTLRQMGGDETKAFWFLKIADLRVLDYYNQELSGYTDKFWNETLFAKLIPFTPILYVDPDNPQLQSETFKPGYVTIYLKDIKFPSDGQGPFQLVYVSPSFEGDDTGPLTGPLIYKINKEYNPNQ